MWCPTSAHFRPLFVFPLYIGFFQIFFLSFPKHNGKFHLSANDTHLSGSVQPDLSAQLNKMEKLPYQSVVSYINSASENVTHFKKW